jgi:hypothetical protein
VSDSFLPVEKSLSINQAALSQAQVAMETLVGGVRQVMSEGAAQSEGRCRQQEALCLQNRDESLERLVRPGCPLTLTP